MATLNKMITRFDPSLTHGLEEGERHYQTVHFPFARRALMRLPHVHSYHINRVTAQLDIAGSWNQRPMAWRFVVMRLTNGHGLAFDPATQATIAWDHCNFLRSLRRTWVDERVLMDRLCGQTVLCKYLIEIDSPVEPSVDAEAAIRRIEAAIVEQAQGRFGLRLVRFNRVTDELIAEPLAEEGQLPTDRVMSATDKLAYIELYADDEHWAMEFFAAAPILDALWTTPLRVFAYAVDERCGLDRDATVGEEPATVS